MKEVLSYSSLFEQIVLLDRSFLLLIKNGSEHCNCALRNIKLAIENNKMLIESFFVANVNDVRDIHTHYGIKSVPALLIFEKGELKNTIMGCQTTDYYSTIFTQASFYLKNKESGKEPKRVTVYSTPTCPWCNTLKSWLRKNGIPFTDIDVSKDEHAARELIRRSGQQGVPQTEINGKIVVGFDQKKLRELLEI